MTAEEREKRRWHQRAKGRYNRWKRGRDQPFELLKPKPVAEGQAPTYAPAEANLLEAPETLPMLQAPADEEEGTTSLTVVDGDRSKLASQRGAESEALVAPRRGGADIDWEDPPMTPQEVTKRAVEEGWEHRQSAPLPPEFSDHISHHQSALLGYRGRLKGAEPSWALKEYIEMEHLGRRHKRKWKKGIKYPSPFSGYDPWHGFLPDAIDDGMATGIDRMATKILLGRMYFRHSCDAAGLQPGGFPDARRPEVLVIGRVNSGKSSLINAITRTNRIAEYADDGGSTRCFNWFRLGKGGVDVIDSPNYSSVKGAHFGALLKEFIATRKALRCVYICIDAQWGLQPEDWYFLSLLGTEGPKLVFVLTKADLKVPRRLAKVSTLVLQDIARLPNASKRLLITSAKDGRGMHEFRYDIARRSLLYAKQVMVARKRLKQREAARHAPPPPSLQDVVTKSVPRLLEEGVEQEEVVDDFQLQG